MCPQAPSMPRPQVLLCDPLVDSGNLAIARRDDARLPVDLVVELRQAEVAEGGRLARDALGKTLLSAEPAQGD